VAGGRQWKDEETPVVEDLTGARKARGSWGRTTQALPLPETDGRRNGPETAEAGATVSRRPRNPSGRAGEGPGHGAAGPGRGAKQQAPRGAGRREGAQICPRALLPVSCCRWSTISSAPWRPPAATTRNCNRLPRAWNSRSRAFSTPCASSRSKPSIRRVNRLTPQLHQAMSMIENPDAEPNTVLAVMQKGYTLNGRLVRPAMVMVSKAPADGQPKGTSGAGRRGSRALKRTRDAPISQHIDNRFVIAVAGRSAGDRHGQDHRNRPRHHQLLRRGHGRRQAQGHRERRG
jgi:hypothetical protein